MRTDKDYYVLVSRAPIPDGALEAGNFDCVPFDHDGLAWTQADAAYGLLGELCDQWENISPRLWDVSEELRQYEQQLTDGLYRNELSGVIKGVIGEYFWRLCTWGRSDKDQPIAV